MEIKKYIYTNSGLIILASSLIISSVILTKDNFTFGFPNFLNYDNNHVKLSGDHGAHQIPIGISSTSNDVTYKSELKIGKGEKLQIILSNGTTDKIEGDDIVANYYHVSRLLIVEYKIKEEVMIKNYNSPIKWSNEP